MTKHQTFENSCLSCSAARACVACASCSSWENFSKISTPPNLLRQMTIQQTFKNSCSAARACVRGMRVPFLLVEFLRSQFAAKYNTSGDCRPDFREFLPSCFSRQNFQPSSRLLWSIACRADFWDFLKKNKIQNKIYQGPGKFVLSFWAPQNRGTT